MWPLRVLRSGGADPCKLNELGREENIVSKTSKISLSVPGYWPSCLAPSV